MIILHATSLTCAAMVHPGDFPHREIFQLVWGLLIVVFFRGFRDWFTCFKHLRALLALLKMLLFIAILVEQILREEIVLENNAFHLIRILNSIIRVVLRRLQAVLPVQISLLFNE